MWMCRRLTPRQTTRLIQPPLHEALPPHSPANTSAPSPSPATSSSNPPAQSWEDRDLVVAVLALSTRTRTLFAMLSVLYERPSLVRRRVSVLMST
ncbi:hypothetical protein GALMADRAFT_229870 [Galerina marginata CBS 339.88]|uniref:Uncharacterized protein n=1 Tax=Galerina marginata (strain CBS 339.88) TaxID=685588 RepID=A0A067ST66_GALM3|nr:hypothetical protein GALMADRAFT_229870 [Galerina marginata CBS 339.88]